MKNVCFVTFFLVTITSEDIVSNLEIKICIQYISKIVAVKNYIDFMQGQFSIHILDKSN